MFDEPQLYSQIAVGQDGAVTVHLAHDHPGAHDPVYRARRNEIAAAALAWSPGRPAPEIAYTEEEREVWRAVCRELAPRHERHAVSEYREAIERMALPTDRIPGLEEVSARLRPLTRWRYIPAAGPIPLEEFYGFLAARVFHCIQYVRHPSVPPYTPEPDVIHEVVGHGHLLATPTFSDLHRLAGFAALRLRDPAHRRFLARVFASALEFGVVVEDGELRAYGAGILSSPGELDAFRGMEHRPLRLVEMGTAEHAVAAYQHVLYRADSVEEIVEVVGGFFATCTDESIAAMADRAGAAT